MSDHLRGKKILVTSGIARDAIDGVHHCVNYTRAGCLGHRAAALLAEAGAEVFLVSTHNSHAAPKGVRVFENSVSSGDLLTAAQGLIDSEKIETCLHLASIPSLRIDDLWRKKMQVRRTGQAEFKCDVTANTSFYNTLQVKNFAGYGWTKKYSRGDNELTAALWEIADAAERLPLLQHPVNIAVDAPPLLAGKKIIVTAGATAERLSFVGDVLSRHAHAAHGFLAAEVFAQMGAEVTLISGPTSRIPAHRSIRHIRIESVFELLACLQRGLPADALVATAGITGHTTPEPLEKIVKEESISWLYMLPTPDVLATVGTLPAALRPATVIGYAGIVPQHTSATQAKAITGNADIIVAIPRRGRTRHLFITQNSVENWGKFDPVTLALRLGHIIAGNQTAFFSAAAELS